MGVRWSEEEADSTQASPAMHSRKVGVLGAQKNLFHPKWRRSFSPLAARAARPIAQRFSPLPPPAVLRPVSSRLQALMGCAGPSRHAYSFVDRNRLYARLRGFAACPFLESRWQVGQ